MGYISGTSKLITSIAAYSQSYACNEQSWYHHGLLVGGVDEVGRGALAGPVVAAAVVLDLGRYNALSEEQQQLIGDSKKKSPAQRSEGRKLIHTIARHYSIQSVRARIIDEIGIHQASLLVMRQAVQHLLKSHPLDLLIVDGICPLALSEEQQGTTSTSTPPQLAITRADSHFKVVGAASILAKVHRDTLMSRLGLCFHHYQKYSFASHKGYPTWRHRHELALHGASPIHRRSFKTVAGSAKLPDTL